MRLPDLPVKESELVSCLGVRRRRAVIGEELLLPAGLLERDRTGDKPRMTSFLRVEKNPCFFSMVVEESVMVGFREREM